MWTMDLDYDLGFSWGRLGLILKSSVWVQLNFCMSSFSLTDFGLKGCRFLHLVSCNIQFWSDSKRKFPQLCKLAAKLVSVSASSVLIQRSFWQGGLIMYLHHAKTLLYSHSSETLLYSHSSETLLKLIFLKCNESVLWSIKVKLKCHSYLGKHCNWLYAAVA